MVREDGAVETDGAAVGVVARCATVDVVAGVSTLRCGTERCAAVIGRRRGDTAGDGDEAVVIGDEAEAVVRGETGGRATLTGTRDVTVGARAGSGDRSGSLSGESGESCGAYCGFALRLDRTTNGETGDRVSVDSVG